MADAKRSSVPAFPLSHSHRELSGTNWSDANGMTLRDYFAAHAMPLMVGLAELQHTGPDEWANACYELADAMLKARQA